MSGSERRGRRVRLPAVVLAALLVLAGAVTLVVALHAQQSPPQPPASVAADPSTPSATPSAAVPAPPADLTGSGGRPSPAVQGPVLPASTPVHLEVPAIGVSSDLLDLGLQSDGTLEVPPLTKDSRAGWYDGSPTPGALGPAVVLGHVDSAEYGPGVFFDLGDLRPGDEITVTREDGTAAVFAVDRVASFPKDAFPTLEVYGNTDHAALRLITCGGDFDARTRNYVDNIVAFASLISSHPA